MRRALPLLSLLAALVVLALSAPALGSEQHPTLNELEGEVMCPTCHTTLDMSQSAAADRIRFFIRRRIAAGDTRSEIKSKLVAQFGQSILAAPPKHGLGLLAWVLPLVGVVLGAGAVGFGAWKWSRMRSDGDDGEVPVRQEALEPELERMLDIELRRFDG